MQKTIFINFNVLGTALVGIFIWLATPTIAQVGCVNSNGGFETVDPVCAANLPNNGSVFHHNCVPNWRSVHGSPTIPTNSTISPPFGGGQNYVNLATESLGSGECQTEAIMGDMDLEPGKSYILTFYHRRWSLSGQISPIDLYIYQSHGTPGQSTSVGLEPCSDLNIPADSELIYSRTGYTKAFWKKVSVCFTAQDYDDYGLLFFPQNVSQTPSGNEFWLIDRICVEEFDICEPVTDLSACVSEESFGFIAYDCPGEYDYNWQLPSGSTALEFTSTEHSVVLQASPGKYQVTITDGLGCSSEETFEVLQDCCGSDCQPPIGLNCAKTNSVVTLKWNAVPDAEGYVVNGIVDDPDCGCEDFDYPTELFPSMLTYTNYVTVNTTEFPCFSWTVSTLCADGVTSVPSEKICFDGYGCETDLTGGHGDGTEKRSGSFGKTSSNGNKMVSIYPNPSEDIFTISINSEKEGPIKMEIFDLQGKKRVNQNRQIQSGQTKLQWIPNSDLPSGSYYITITSNSWSETQKVVLMKNK